MSSIFMVIILDHFETSHSKFWKHHMILFCPIFYTSLLDPGLL